MEMARGTIMMIKAMVSSLIPKTAPKNGEHEHNQYNDQVAGTQATHQGIFFEPDGKLQKGTYAHINGPGVVHDPKGPANHQNEDDDAGLALKTHEQCGKNLPGLGLTFGRMENGHAAVLGSYIGAAWHQPGGQGRQHNQKNTIT